VIEMWAWRGGGSKLFHDCGPSHLTKEEEEVAGKGVAVGFRGLQVQKNFFFAPYWFQTRAWRQNAYDARSKDKPVKKPKIGSTRIASAMRTTVGRVTPNVNT
jgi:hypothetical protein